MRNSAFDCARCEKNRDELLKTSPIIVYMRQNIKQLGGDLGPHNIRCRTCPEKAEGGFDHEYGIRICANYVETKKKLEDVLAHEMVHAYDHLRFKTNLDRDTDLRHSACSEVRYFQICTASSRHMLMVRIDQSQQFERRMSMGE